MGRAGVRAHRSLNTGQCAFPVLISFESSIGDDAPTHVRIIVSSLLTVQKVIDSEHVCPAADAFA
jgi:hypothetical protein